EIGRRMGVSKQAAQRRFVATPTVAPRDLRGARWSRFTPRARQVVAHIQDEARRAGHGTITTDHVLLGLLDEPDALAARAIVAGGVALDELRATITARLGPPAGAVPDEVPFGADAQKLLELTL